MRRAFRVTIPPGQTWPQAEQGAGPSLAPFNWVRIHNRGLADIAFDFSTPTTDTLGPFEVVRAGRRLVRNLGDNRPGRGDQEGEPPDEMRSELYIRNLDVALTAFLMVEVADMPIIDLVSSAGDSGAPSVTLPAAPVPANLLGGAVIAPGTIITVPAGRTFLGSINLEAVLQVAAGGGAANGSATVTVTGAGAAPVGPVAAVVLSVAAVPAAVSPNVVSGEDSKSGVYVYGGSAGAVVALTNTGLTGVAASAMGALL